LSFIYGTKDLRGLINSIWKKDSWAIFDGENLMTLWSTFVATPEFDPQPFKNTKLEGEINDITNALKYANH